jgi:DNA-directed RNA polymerase specialized sigma24 family protein
VTRAAQTPAGKALLADLALPARRPAAEGRIRRALAGRTRAEAAAALGVSVPTVQRLVRRLGAQGRP